MWDQTASRRGVAATHHGEVLPAAFTGLVWHGHREIIPSAGTMRKLLNVYVDVEEVFPLRGRVA